MTFSQFAGIIPAVIFPAATAYQLWRIMKTRTAAGVSGVTWTLFGLANLAMYAYTERYGEWQAIVGLLGTAVIDFCIAAAGFLACARIREDSRVPALNEN